MFSFRKGVAVAAVAVLIATWRSTRGPLPTEDDLFALKENQTQKADTITVMSFNVRLDGLEQNPDNHFTRRVSRLRDTIMKWKPTMIGLQEPFGGQLHDILRALPKGHTYRALGYNREGVNPDHLTHPSRHHDFQCGIVYNTAELDLLEQGYRWLSTTPDVANSRDWGSRGIRTVNVAVFKVKKTGETVMLFNTHLDVWSEAARRGQSAVLLETVRVYKERFRGAAAFVTGDFNSAPGQSAYRTLLAREEAQGVTLHDAWEGTENTNDVAVTFHGWMGVTLSNSVVSRATLSMLFTAHAMGFNLPASVPSSMSLVLRAAHGMLSALPQYGVRESMPLHVWSLSRFHVDWVLHTAEAAPLLVFVGDARDANFSSDHFPLVAVFKLPGSAGTP
ncbi:hypothetical protein DIPPA_21427 [Diplonema papillatum]|nr:hypothetical protein DIPPA_21427 [Diplonema papillatum]